MLEVTKEEDRNSHYVIRGKAHRGCYGLCTESEVHTAFLTGLSLARPPLFWRRVATSGIRINIMTWRTSHH